MNKLPKDFRNDFREEGIRIAKRDEIKKAKKLFKAIQRNVQKHRRIKEHTISRILSNTPNWGGLRLTISD